MPDRDESPPALDRPFLWAERVVYGGVAVLLVVGALAVLVDGVSTLVQELGKDIPHAVEDMLDRLLLVFILIELLSAIRTTLAERRLVAEPFLLVGMIATIKEIVVIGIGAREALGKKGDEFTHSMQAIGVLTFLLLGLAIAGFLVRRKEREPDEVKSQE